MKTAKEILASFENYALTHEEILQAMEEYAKQFEGMEDLNKFLSQSQRSYINIPSEEIINKQVTLLYNKFVDDDSFDFGMRCANWMKGKIIELNKLLQ